MLELKVRINDKLAEKFLSEAEAVEAPPARLIASLIESWLLEQRAIREWIMRNWTDIKGMERYSKEEICSYFRDNGDSLDELAAELWRLKWRR